MKKIFLIILSFIGIIQLNAQTGVAISSSGAPADASAILDVQSTSQGLLVPRMTQTERDAISSPARGLLIYQYAGGVAGFYYNAGIPSSPDWELIAIDDGTSVTQIDDLSDAKTGNNSLYLGTTPSSTADQNTVIGHNAGTSLANDGEKNILIGKDAGGNITTGDDNILLTIGNAGLSTGSGNILIGKYLTSFASSTTDNQMNIGNTIFATGMTTAGAKVGIGNGNNAPKSTLDVGGSISKPIVVKNGDYTATDADHTIIFYYPQGTGEVVLTLPEASTCKGRIYYIRTIETTTSADRLVIAAHSGDLIDGEIEIEIGFQGLDLDYGQIVDGVVIQSDGTMWWMISASIQPENP